MNQMGIWVRLLQTYRTDACGITIRPQRRCRGRDLLVLFIALEGRTRSPECEFVVEGAPILEIFDII